MSLTLALLAVLAGTLTVFSPCILPLLPLLLSASADSSLHHRPFWIVLGLTASFTLFGVTFAIFGSFLGFSGAALRYGALGLLLFFGLSLLAPRLWGGLGARIAGLTGKIPWGRRFLSERTPFSTLVLGASLGLVWAPCAGPILGIILTLAALQSSFGAVLLLMGGYAFGAALPMLLIGYGGRRVSERAKSFRRWGAITHKALGALTIASVIILFFNLDTLLLAKLPAQLFLSSRIEKELVKKAPGDRGNQLGPDRASAAGKKSAYPILGAAPEFKGITTWLNSSPLSAADLRGKVVLVDFWTYSCINCIRTLPTVTRWYRKYKDQGLVIVGVHTPEFQFEKDVANIKSAISRYGISYPVAVDNDYGTWKAYSNQFWPAKYLIDPEGNLRLTHFGEGDEDLFEEAIQSLLIEANLLHGSGGIEPLKRNIDFSKIRSPETYVGYNRAANFSSPEGISPDQTQNYSSPPSLRLNQWALQGMWNIAGEAAELQSPQGKIEFRFEAPKLNLVMKGSEKGIPAKVWVDGVLIRDKLRGADVAPDGTVLVKDPRLYNLVTLPAEDDKEHLFELIFDGPSVALYAFTFG